jgi:RsiW-degrading membrane proteinase PrsW (M82 family)
VKKVSTVVVTALFVVVPIVILFRHQPDPEPLKVLLSAAVIGFPCFLAAYAVVMWVESKVASRRLQ